MPGEGTVGPDELIAVDPPVGVGCAERNDADTSRNVPHHDSITGVCHDRAVGGNELKHARLGRLIRVEIFMDVEVVGGKVEPGADTRSEAISPRETKRGRFDDEDLNRRIVDRGNQRDVGVASCNRSSAGFSQRRHR